MLKITPNIFSRSISSINAVTSGATALGKVTTTLNVAVSELKLQLPTLKVKPLSIVAFAS